VSRLSVLAARTDSLGDVILMGPALRAIAAAADVTLLVSPVGEPAARALPGVSSVIVHSLPWIAADPDPVDADALARLVHEVREVAPDRAIVFTSHHQSALPLALLLRLAGVPTISAISEEYPGSLLDVRHHTADDVHEVERALSLAAAAGFRLAAGDPGDLRVDVAPESVALPWPDEEPYVVVHPGASVPARAWAPERYRELVAELRRQGQHVAVTGGAGEAALTAYVSGDARETADLGGQTTFAGLASLLGRARLLVTGNTGPAHLAAAVATPVVSLYAPTVPAARWRPWAVPHVLLGDQAIACAGCRARMCPVPGHPCLALDVPSVLEAIARLDEHSDPLQEATA
jgi:ADP-heptose:LPS heptosyltransferase